MESGTLVNQKWIADKLNLSIATVSRSLRNHSSVSSETRKRVCEVAAEAGYVLPRDTRHWVSENGLGVATKIGVLSQVDLATRTDRHELSIHVLPAITFAARRSDLSVMVQHVAMADRDRILDRDRVPHMLRQGSVDGLVLVHYFPEHVVERLSHQLPCVSLVHHHPNLPMDCVGIDSSSVMARLVGVLASRGHSRIGFATLPLSQNPNSWGSARYSGYVLGLHENGLSYDSQEVVEVDYRRQDPEEVELDLFCRKIDQGVRAWMCVNDRMAFLLAVGLERRGYRVGSDVVVTGFDGWELPEGCPSIISIAPNINDLGAVAVQVLLDRIKNPEMPPRHVLLRGEVVHLPL